MLHEFVTANRLEILSRCRAKIANRPAPTATDAEIEHGVPLFLDQLVDTLRRALGPNPTIGRTATQHGKALQNSGFTVAQVVHDYGGVCQAITELAAAMAAPITAREFQTLNLCLDEAIADAVTEYGKMREHEGTERMGRLIHELRNLLNTAVLSFESLKSANVGVDSRTGAVLGHSLKDLRMLVDRELAEVRLEAGIYHRETVAIRELIEDLEVAATLEADARQLQLSVGEVEKDLVVIADRQILESVVANLLQNAFKFTPAKGHVWLRPRAAGERVLIEVEDQCGGLPPGVAEELFRPFEQHGADRSGLGLGLVICYHGVQVNGGDIRVVNRPGVGCVFTIDLPREHAV